MIPHHHQEKEEGAKMCSIREITIIMDYWKVWKEEEGKKISKIRRSNMDVSNVRPSQRDMS